MSEVEVLRPEKGHYLLLVAAFGSLLAVLGITASTLYDALVADAKTLGIEQVGWLVLLWTIVLPLQVLPGRYVAFRGDSEVSKPSLFPRQNPRFILGQDFASYTRTTRPRDGEKVNIVVLRTKAGKRVRFSDGKTPGCTMRVLTLMQRWQVPEEHHGAGGSTRS